MQIETKQQFVEACGIQQFGSPKSYGVKIMLSSPFPLSNEVGCIARDHADAIIREVSKADAITDPDVINERELVKASLLALFDDRIYAEEIPNEYTKDAWGISRPWFLVTTRIGHIKIGWRKRVIEIDWARTDVSTSAEDLFPAESVTKLGRSIHAWGYDDAKRYIETLNYGRVAT